MAPIHKVAVVQMYPEVTRHLQAIYLVHQLTLT
jgi:hypothetical protein